MGDGFEVKITVDEDGRFQDALNRAKGVSDDLRIPFSAIGQHWFQGNRAIFSLRGPGQYTDLAESTKKEKQRKVGFVYPILKRTGALEKSITNPRDQNAIYEPGKQVLILGSRIPYGIYHQSSGPRTRLPYRPFVFVGPETPYATQDQKKRPQVWLEILNDYVIQKLNQEINK